MDSRNYEAEVCQKWGSTDAYRQYAEKTVGQTQQDRNVLAAGMESLLAEFAVCMKSGKSADSAEAQGLVQKLRSYITENCYCCTDEILAGLGQMYVSDARFRRNIDRHGPGTAQFISEAVAACCGK